MRPYLAQTDAAELNVRGQAEAAAKVLSCFLWLLCECVMCRVCGGQVEADRRAEEARRQAEAAAKVLSCP
jgi:hypothetical protein